MDSPVPNARDPNAQENLETAALRIESKTGGPYCRCFLRVWLMTSTPSGLIVADDLVAGSVSQWRKVQVMAQLSKAFAPWLSMASWTVTVASVKRLKCKEATTEPRLSKSHTTPRGVQAVMNGFWHVAFAKLALHMIQDSIKYCIQ